MEEKPKRPKAPAKSVRSRASAGKSSAPRSPGKTTPPVTARAKAPKRPATAKATKSIPALLLEGDQPPAPARTGPGERYALGATTPPAESSETGDLPEAYGTRRLLLTARDPHWIYAHWDFTNDQLRQVNSASRDGHLIVRVFRDQPGGNPVVEQHVHPESRNWFIHVPFASARYIAQLGYYDDAGTWNPLGESCATVTPPDALSSDTSVRFETIPVEVPFQKLLQLVKTAVAENVPLVQALSQLRAEGVKNLPEPERIASAPWTAQQERALAQVISIDSVRRVWMGSLEITELIRRKLEQEISSQAAAAIARGEQFSLGAELGGVSSISSPFGGEGKRRGFWFNVNAELIIYGATEPNAKVTIGGRNIQLRPDGTFSFRFALPDGEYRLPVVATSADQEESRSADLKFRRATEYRGDVGAHPQDRALKTPRAENIR
jgi:uncharacterized protein